MQGYLRIIILSGFLTASSIAADFSADQLAFFEKKIRPVLAEKCYGCHSADARKLKAHLQLDHREHLLQGGDTRASILPGKPDESLLIESLSYGNTDLQMPPKGSLDPKILADFTKWITDGAAWPEEAVPHRGAPNKLEQFDLQKRYNEHWSWRDINPADPPSVKHEALARSPIDRFILQNIENAGLQPANPADKRTLIRRAYFDLIGLPPSPQQITAFLADESPKAFEKAVDQLLASPHFGEKWARHWMDLVRYAETYGHEFDYPLNYAFEYRDYLIRAFNRDVPYDLFVKEHLAGDLIKEPRRNPEQQFNESILGTAFWYFHEATHAPTDVRQDEADHMDNQLDVFGKSFLGLTVACARCHDHKFDAISTADYYALTAYLQSSCRQEYPIDPNRTREKAVQSLYELEKAGTSEIQKLDSKTAAKELPGKYFLAAIKLVREAIKAPSNGNPWSGEVFDDFESGNFDKWKIKGDAFGKKPTPGKVGNQKLSGEFGKGLANSYSQGNDGRTGTLISNAFTITKPYVNFLIAGGKDKKLGFEFWIDGKSVLSARGKNNDTLEVAAWNVGAHVGSRAELRIIDKARGGWGHIEVDRIVFSETPVTNPNSLPAPSASKVESYAEQNGLDLAKLLAWTRVFATIEKDHRSPNGFFSQLIKNPKVIRGIVDELERNRSRRADFEKNAVRFVSFTDGDIAEGWSTSGFAFQKPIKTPGLSFEKGRPFAIPGVISSSRLGDHQTGILRSPTFKIEKTNIHIKARAENLFARVVMDNYHMAQFNGLLFNGTSEKSKNTEGEFRWFSFGGHLNKYLGHNAFLEFVDKGSAKVEIEEIWFSDQSAPALVAHPVVRVATANNTESLEDVAANLDKAWQAKEHDSHFFNWMIANQLIQLDDISPRLADLVSEGQLIESKLPPERYAVAMAEGVPEHAFVHIRGSHRNLGEAVPRRFLTALGGKEGSRLSLAEEIVSPKNPLASRVMMNRIWHHLFGRGIVPTVDNFGPMGQAASHPELLDWLAADFSGNGWSMKRAIRQIVLSHTYRQSSLASPKNDPVHLANTDPDNVLLYRMPIRRLQAEAIRDAVLAVSGRLDPTLYGPSIPTYRTAFMTGRGARGNGPLDGAGRRSIYGAVYRNFLSPFLQTFDQPSPFGPKGRRSISNVPAQALALMNDPLVIEQTKLWAKNQEENDHRIRIKTMYEQALGVEPDAERIQSLLNFVEEQGKRYQKLDERVWADLAHVLINMKDFVYLK